MDHLKLVGRFKEVLLHIVQFDGFEFLLFSEINILGWLLSDAVAKSVERRPLVWQMGVRYKVAMSAHCHKSVPVLIWPQTILGRCTWCWQDRAPIGRCNVTIIYWVPHGIISMQHYKPVMKNTVNSVYLFTDNVYDELFMFGWMLWFLYSENI